MGDAETKMRHASEMNAAEEQLRKGLAMVNAAGSRLNALGIEPHIGGWTKPGTWGYVRCQGTLSVKFEELPQP